MFGYFKKKREKRERAAELNQMAESVGASLRAELDLFIVSTIKPRREAYLEIFRGQLERLDERMVELEAPAEVTRLEMSGIDYRLMLENWSNHEGEHIQEAEDWLSSEFEIADVTGVRAEYEAAIKEALADQHLKLMSDGLGVLLELVPEARADAE